MVPFGAQRAFRFALHIWLWNVLCVGLEIGASFYFSLWNTRCPGTGTRFVCLPTVLPPSPLQCPGKLVARLAHWSACLGPSEPLSSQFSASRS